MKKKANQNYLIRQRIMKFILKHKLRYASGILVLAGVSILQLLVPRITGDVIDYLNEGRIVQDTTLKYILIILGISLSAFILHFLSRQLILKAGNLYVHLERMEIFNKIITLSMGFFAKRSTGDLMAHTTNDTEAVRHMLGRGITIIINIVVLMISSIIIISRSIDPQMAMLLLIPMPFILIIMSRFGVAINRRFRVVQETFADMTEKVQENVTGVRVIKAFCQEEYEERNFERFNRMNYQANMKLVKLQGFFGPLVKLVMDSGQLLVLIVGGKMVVEGNISLGDFIALNSYVAIIMRPLMMVGNFITLLQRGTASAARISEILREKPDIYDGKFGKPENGCNITGYIEFNNVDFSYSPELEPALSNVSFKVARGKTLGIIGRVGSGKSTIAALLLRLYDTGQRGRILLDGIDIANIPLRELREAISYVPQENSLFSDTIEKNIDFNPTRHDMKSVKAAADEACIHQAIVEIGKGYQSILGERGVNISGGQKQRISIARAFLKDSPVLILDDCLSAVDTATERKILENIKKNRKERACIIIAHRVSSIMDADEILMMDDGKIIERGTHDELIAMNGLYSRIYHRQMLEEELNDA